MRPKALATLAVAALLSLGSPGVAQEAETEASNAEIVISGTRTRDEQVKDFVSALTPAPAGSIPRFIDQVCPVAVGLVPVQNERIATRIRQVAAAIDLDVAGRDCVPNAFVIVTPDKRAFIERLTQERPGSFGMLTPRQVRRLARSPGPAAAWQMEGRVDSNGIPLRFDEVLGAYVNDTTEAASRIRTVSRRAFDAAVVIVETRALTGLTATQLADYAAMRLFAQLDPARLPTPAPPTILTILEAPMGSPVPLTMTSWDAGLLRGLYSSSPNLYVGAQRSAIAKEVTKELERRE